MSSWHVCEARGHRLPLPRNASMALHPYQHKTDQRQLAQARSSTAGGKRRLRAGILLALTLACSGCDTVSGVTDSMFGPGNAPSQGQPGFVQGFLGGVVADEPRAALAAREVLSAGGTAADAAVALGFRAERHAAVAGRTGRRRRAASPMPPTRSRSTKACPRRCCSPRSPPPASAANADRPAAVPMLARGLYLLHARYGSLPFESLIVPAEQLARFGTPAPRALVRDIALVAGPLLADPNARAVFSQNGAPLAEGQTLLQPDLGATLAQIRVSGVGDLYTGALARRIVQASPLAGGPLALADLNGALPRWRPPSCCRTGATRSLSFHHPRMAAWPPLQPSRRFSAIHQRLAPRLPARSPWRSAGGKVARMPRAC